VDYDGSRTTFSSSMNYNLEEYASDVVYNTRTSAPGTVRCHPAERIRRAITLHEVLVVDIIGLMTPPTPSTGRTDRGEPQVLKELAYTRDNISVKNFAEMYHDAITRRTS